MPLPSNIVTITVTGTFVDFSGVAMSGSVTFTPPAELIDASQSAFLSPGPITVELDTNGHFSVTLPCTDTAGLAPAGWVYLVTENVRGLRSYTVALPHTLGSSVDLSAVAPVTGNEMPLPSGINTITVTGKFLDSFGNPQSGSVIFNPPPQLIDPTSAIIYAKPTSANLDSTGSFSVTLVCTDNPALVPVGWHYTVVEQIGGASRSYPIYLPHSLGSSVDLSAVTPIPTQAGTPALIPSGRVAPGYGALAYDNTWTGNQTFTGSITFTGTVTGAFRGAAGGDLSGNFPNPSVAAVNGVTVTGTPSAGQVITATSPTTATWQNQTGGSGGGASLDTNAADIAPLGTRAAGAIGLAADAGHVHAMPTLDQVGTAAANVSLGNHKLTAVATGVAGTDAVNVSQLPTTLPPSGSAGGDLTGSYPNPTVTATSNFKAQVETVRLDQMAAPTAAVSLNSQKLTAVATGVLTTDGANVGQIPTTLPPSGSASGDLSGNYPGPSVAKISGVAVSGTPSNGQVLTASSSTAAAWATPVSGASPATTVVSETGYGQSTAVGTLNNYAREDHTHGSPALTSTAPATTLGIGQAAALGTATTPAKADHVHPLAAAASAGASAVGDSAATGSATTFSASDHRHAREAFGGVTALVAFNTASATGSATTVAHSDHVHGAPALPAATTGAAGIVQLDGTAGDITALGAQAAGATGKAADAGHVHPTTGLVTSVNGASGAVSVTAAGIAAAARLIPTTVKTAAYTAQAGDLVPVDTTSASVTVTLVSAPADGTVIGIKQVAMATGHTVTVTCGGTDTFNTATGPVSGTLVLLNQALLLQYYAASKIWYVVGDDMPLSQLDARYAQLANNLSDLASAATARTNLGLTGAATATLPLSLANGGTGQSSASSAYNALSPLTTLGDLVYASAANTAARLAGNTSATRNFLRQTGNGTISAAPAWDTLAAGDLPAATTGAQGAVQLAGDLAGTGSSPAVAKIQGTTIASPPGVNTQFLAGDGTWQSVSGGGTASSTVVSETSYAQSAAAGSATAYSRGDHTHGTQSLSSSAATASAVGDSAAVGTGTTPARSDHVHGREAFATPGSSAVGDSAAAGSATTVSRSDHTHGREAFGSVTATTGSYTVVSANGTATTPARSDHNHGLPTFYEYDIPSDRGLVEWNFPILGVSLTTQAFTSGTIYGISLVARTNKSISKVSYNAASTASTPTAGQNLVGLYSVSGTTWTQQAVTGDLSTWTPSGQITTVNFGNSVTLVAGATYVLLALSVATTAVQLRGITSTTMSWLNGGTGNSGSPWMKFFTGGTSQTTLPASFAASGTTMSQGSALAPWFALS